MPLTVNIAENTDKTKDLNITGVKELDGGIVYGSAYVHGQKDAPDLKKLEAPFNVAGVSVGAANLTGSSVGVQAQHMPAFGSQVTASTNLNILKTDSQKLDVNAFTTQTIPKAGSNYATHGAGLDYIFTGGSLGVQGQHTPTYGSQVKASTNLNVLKTDNHKLDMNAFASKSILNAGPNIATHGVGVDYMFKDRLGANAAISHTPILKQTDYSVGGNLNLYRDAKTSVDFRAGANRTDTSFGRGNWEQRGMLQLTRKF